LKLLQIIENTIILNYQIKVEISVPF
jgi:hypothetical protein